MDLNSSPTVTNFKSCNLLLSTGYVLATWLVSNVLPKIFCILEKSSTGQKKVLTYGSWSTLRRLNALPNWMSWLFDAAFETFSTFSACHQIALTFLRTKVKIAVDLVQLIATVLMPNSFLIYTINSKMFILPYLLYRGCYDVAKWAGLLSPSRCWIKSSLMWPLLSNIKFSKKMNQSKRYFYYQGLVWTKMNLFI